MAAEPVRRLPRAQRREQILTAATRAFARTGYTATGLDDVAAEAGVTHVILYRHFTSKNDLYRAVLDRACTRLAESVGTGDYDGNAIPALLRAAAADPDGFRLLFRHAAREPEFKAQADRFRTEIHDIAHLQIKAYVADPAWARWASQLTPTVAIESVLAWLDAGQPDPARAAHRIRAAIGGVTAAAAQSTPTA
jgi:AcrR family transcriptional regulator